MKKLSFKIILFLMVISVALAFISELAYAFAHQDCACCTTNKCHAATKCHNAAKVCFCSQQTIQVVLPASTSLFQFAFAGYLMQSPDFTRPYLFSARIFHPPRA
ncbi:hypothetical protein D4Q80_02010 [bacterium]|nr:MAG: hypothetical protein D4Q80_02010 [bacterium]